MDKRSVFVTGTDTGVGKTLVAGLLGRFFSERGLRTVPQKWIQTGSSGFSEDIAAHLKLMGKTKKEFKDHFPHMSPCVFSFPSSPHLSARLEQKTIDVEKILRSFHVLEDEFDAVIVEGAGGPMVPIDHERTIVDIWKKTGLPAVVVAENRLGAINQTILTIEALKKRDISILGIVFNQISKKENRIVLKDNPVIVSELTGEEVLCSLTYSKDPDDLYSMFAPAGQRILDKLSKRDIDG